MCSDYGLSKTLSATQLSLESDLRVAFALVLILQILDKNNIFICTKAYRDTKRFEIINALKKMV